MCMVEMAIFNIQRAITVKVGKQELRFMCSACHLIVVTFVSSFMKICQAVLKLWRRHKNCKLTKGNNSKSRKTRITVHVFRTLSYGVNVCVKFHENMSSCFKVMEWKRKL